MDNSGGDSTAGSYFSQKNTVEYCSPNLRLAVKDTQVPYNTTIDLTNTDIIPGSVSVNWMTPGGKVLTDAALPVVPQILSIDYAVVGSTPPDELSYCPGTTDGVQGAPGSNFTGRSNDTDFIVRSVTYRLGEHNYTVTPGNGFTVTPYSGNHKVTPGTHDFTVYTTPVDVTYKPTKADPADPTGATPKAGDTPETTPEFHNGLNILVLPNKGIWKNSPDDQTVPLTADITLGDPTRSEYIFAGWKVLPGTGNIKYIFEAQWVKGKTGRATVIKCDSADSEKLLQDAVFELYRVDDDAETVKDVLVGTGYTTGVNGVVTAEGLIPGTYYWKEISAPKGYKLSGEKYRFTVKADAETKLTIPNTLAVDANDIFSDDHFAYIIGRPDGYVHPKDQITRAEAMTLVNRVTGRTPNGPEHLLPANEMITWPDNKRSDWYYVDVQEATNSHYYDRNEDTSETWTEIRPARNWAELEY